MADFEAVFDLLPREPMEASFDLQQRNQIDATFELDIISQVHNDLLKRDVDNCHPIKAITGLQEALDNAGKVKDVEVDGQSVVNQQGVAQIDLSGKQDVIDDLSEIRSGAALGATAVQYALVITDYTGD